MRNILFGQHNSFYLFSSNAAKAFVSSFLHVFNACDV